MGRLISLIEHADPGIAELLAEVPAWTDSVHVVGLTGPPGAGKSTMVSALVREYRARGLVVGVLAVDPSSPFSGGALLGDRVRMREHSFDSNVMIRSMSARGHLGGMARATPLAIQVYAFAGCDVIIVETVGVGQSEVDVASVVDTTIVVVPPHSGDGVQAAKAGVLEAGDVFVVNKADLEGSDTAARQVETTVALTHIAGGWRPPVLKLSADRDSAASLVESLNEHRRWLGSGDEALLRRRRRIELQLRAIAVDRILSRLQRGDGAVMAKQIDGVLAGQIDMWTAVDTLAGIQSG